MGAFTEGGYNVPACVGHLGDPAGDDCLAIGCCARRACPIGTQYRYERDQARFHMEAFRRANSPSGQRNQ